MSRVAAVALLFALIPITAAAQEDESQQSQGPMTIERVHNTWAIAPDFKVTKVDGTTGQRGALLGRQMQRGGLPKVFTTNSSAEYWRGDGSLVHTRFDQLPRILSPGDLVVVNVSGTLAAAVSGHRSDGSPVRVHFATRAPELDESWRTWDYLM